MIKLFELNKYFNKGRQNEIHVINNTTLEFPEKGLVSITGPSGCGKTTLLNVIGGLDSFSSGSIEIDGKVISKYRPLEWDIIRNKYIGYIFQNYNLINDKTVYENIEVSLNMAGLYKKDEIEERINYVLDAVGMYNYRRRNVRALSGGQQQRVAIARALAKNPKVILADEPTGNLDNNNTFEIMSIIKKISQNCLVILVSHERSMVDFYSDRVIELSDGEVINDFDNSGAKTLEHTDERNIYLKDLNKDEKDDSDNQTRYYENEKDETLSFDIIEVKDSIYIKAKTKSNKKIKFITDDTEIKLIDDHYKARDSKAALDYDFDMTNFKKLNTDDNKKSFIRFRDVLLSGVKKVTRKKKLFGRLFLVAYFVISALIVYQIATFASLTKVEDSQFVTVSKELISVTSEEPMSSSDIKNILETVDNVELAPYTDQVRMYIEYFDFYQGSAGDYVSGYPVKASWYSDLDLAYGGMPTNSLGIVVDKWVIEEALESKEFSDLGVNDFESFIGMDIYTSSGEATYKFTISGICDTGSPLLIVEDESIYSFLEWTNTLPYGSMKDRIIITEGEAIQNDTEILISENDTEYNVGETLEWDNEIYTIVGKYSAKDELFRYELYDYSVIGSNSILDDFVIEMIADNIYFGDYYYYNGSKVNLYLYSDDMDRAIEDVSILDDDYTVVNSYESLRAEAIATNKENVSQRVQSIIITLVGIVIYIYFMMRSSMLSRIKEIGIYRSIGATKRDIYKIFLGEILAFTTIGSVSGYLIMSYLVNQIQNMLGSVSKLIGSDFFYLPLHYFLGGLIGLYLINIIFGLLPVFNLLRKTPSEINAKFDI